MKYNQLIFLEQSYKDSQKSYQNILDNNNKWPWDIVVITASNETQKKVYEKQIQSRIEDKLLPLIEIIVVSDKDNKRIGSGGATLNVIKVIKEKYHTFDNKKILLINSGGDSKRVPQYSACGKLFSKVPRLLPSNNISTLFDEFMITFSSVADRIKEGILIVSGDVLLLFNPLQVDLDNAKVAAISIKAPVKTGTHHGVFLSDNNNILKRFLHKETEENLFKLNAVYEDELIDIDTGCIYLSKEVVEKLYELVENDSDESKYINDTNRLSFYGDLLYPFACDSTIDEYLHLPSEGLLDDNQIEIRKNIWNSLNKYRMKVIKTFPSEFIHIGTTKEAKELFVNASNKYQFLNWKTNILTNNHNNIISCANSLIDDNATIKDNTLIEDSYIESGSIVGTNSIVINVKGKIFVKDNTVVQILPVSYDNKTKYVGRIYGINDNPKNINNYFDKSYQDIFGNIFDENTSLWDLELYPICDTIKEAIKSIELIESIVDKTISKKDFNNYCRSKRLSLNQSFNIASIEESINENRKLKDTIISHIIFNDFKNGIDINELMQFITVDNAKSIFENIKNFPQNTYKKDALLANLSKKFHNEIEQECSKYENSCYDTINQLIKSANTCFYNGPYNIKNEVIEELSPARINLAGGWSDTPPYCLENGGTVLNAAIKLNNELPIKVIIEPIETQQIVLRNDDIGEEVVIKDITILNDFKDLSNPFLLSYASLYILGVTTWDKLNNKGLKITTKVNIPKGSGLGTSSILSGTIIRALARYLSIPLTDDDLFTYVLYLEQLISTGGGWQDQIGGLTRGIKLIETKPSNKQIFKLDYIEKNELIQELDNRLVLIYTGQRRIAKNVLRKIMNKYIRNDTETCYIIKEIQRIALLMKFELEKGNIQEFNNLLNKHSKLIIRLDEEVTNTCINHIIKECSEYTDAAHMMGAGGGGFIMAVMKENIKVSSLEEHLSKAFSDSGVKVYQVEFYW